MYRCSSRTTPQMKPWWGGSGTPAKNPLPRLVGVSQNYLYSAIYLSTWDGIGRTYTIDTTYSFIFNKLMYILHKSPVELSPRTPAVNFNNKRQALSTASELRIFESGGPCSSDLVAQTAPLIPLATIYTRTCVKCHAKATMHWSRYHAHIPDSLPLSPSPVLLPTCIAAFLSALHFHSVGPNLSFSQSTAFFSFCARSPGRRNSPNSRAILPKTSESAAALARQVEAKYNRFSHPSGPRRLCQKSSTSVRLQQSICLQ